MRDDKGRFIKGNQGFWLGKKRPNLINTGASKTMIKPGQRLSVATEFKKGVRNNPQGEFKRKNKDLTYHGLHSWIRSKLGSARLRSCENCGSKKFVEWANKSLEYKEDVTDWMALCAKCHDKYDRAMGWGVATRRYKL